MNTPVLSSPVYRLRPDQVPDFPEGGKWGDALRWSLAVMDPGDRDIEFLASLLSYCLKHGGLTEKQAHHATRTITRVRDRWRAGELQFCQSNPQQRAEHPSARLMLTPANGMR
ncbi:hypothetical protein [Chelatococcus reniformis]|uniref:Uncharacterized protein n=1 Tax=Chelatococcus reniformis TaxID=1494448 RepID=A0A916XG07_9HYPH|nr:hypothetical protein [Chelatococcus reniformis]GGC70768.1 hypothetical protein GCM10010994_31660 [Chelatococcus reniformis]